ncbi:MAG: hypothetical protein HY754_13845 [Nitrospirae bacterium]|nr:hypothetical protein [Nitrospirota bacterium]
MNELTSAFTILKKEFPGYGSRPEQFDMAGEVYTCLKAKRNLLIEAGTGVGKSFAYLIPAILSNEKTIVSTASIALQDQLLNKDLACLYGVLPKEFSYAILKGKNNYLCLKREREFAEMGELYKKFQEWISVIEDLKNLKTLLAFDKVVHRLTAFLESTFDDELHDKIDTTIAYINSLSSVIADFIERQDNDKVYYLAENKNAVELKSSLVESQRPFNDMAGAYESVIMTSATLTAGNDFGFLKQRFGISGFKERVIGSPFDYKKQSLLYIDRELPRPDVENNEAYLREGLKTIEGLINASEGRALVLFTSYKHLRYVSKNIRIPYPFKTQGDMPAARLIEWFRETPDSVLLATATFWQGIDVKGQKLSLVILSKIPFGSPGDPVYDERCKRLGEKWFDDLALPSAILLLRQGFGRLIRGVDDYGVIAILDTRLTTRSYGKGIVLSLPDMNIVHSIEDVKSFFDSIPQNKNHIEA